MDSTTQKLTKDEVFHIIIDKLVESYNKKDEDYQSLCLLFEAAYGYTVDKRCYYDTKEKCFLVWEDTNYN